MFENRYATVSESVDPQKVRSDFTRELIGIYDTYLLNDDPLDFMLVDPYQKFFLVVSDLAILCESQVDSDRYTVLPYVRMIYTVRQHRSKGIQRALLEELKAIADDVGQSFSIVADPFVLGGTQRELNAYEAIGKLEHNGEHPTENYMADLVKQTQRFKAAGLTNVKFSNASVTEPFQQFVYVSANENPLRLEILNENKVEYLINYSELEKMSK